MILAEMTPPPGLSSWLGCLAFVVWLAASLKKLLTKAPEAPQPFVVKEHAEFVTKTDHQKAITEITERHADETQDIKDELKRHAARRAEIYEQNRIQSVQLGKLEEKTTHTNVQVQRLDGKMDRILERLPRAKNNHET